MIDLDRLEQLAARATPTPWEPIQPGDELRFKSACDPEAVAALIRAVRALDRIESMTALRRGQSQKVHRVARAALAPFRGSEEGW